jgi:glycine/D-amino acid oxidase-like deaminating enzyme
MSNRNVIVIGAGVFGAWTAWHRLKLGRKVLLVGSYAAQLVNGTNKNIELTFSLQSKAAEQRRSVH